MSKGLLKGEKMSIERLKNGLYKVEYIDGEIKVGLVGCAASTAIWIISHVFKGEASGDMLT